MARQAISPSEESQPDMFGPAPVQVYRPDPEKVRRRLHMLLAEARAAKTMPWDSTILSLHRTIFPQMSNYLPEDEAARFRAEFDAELARLEAA